MYLAKQKDKLQRHLCQNNALAQPRKGVFMDIQKKKIHEHLWLIDGHF